MNPSTNIDRRQFLNAAALATAGVALGGKAVFAQSASGGNSALNLGESARDLVARYGRPNSRFNGVLIGTIAPYSFGSGSAEDLLKWCVALGISAVELQGGPVEQYLGVGGGGGPGGGRGGIPNATPDQTAAVNAINNRLQPLEAAQTTAQADLTAASLRGAGRDEINARAQALADAELQLAEARADAVTRLQASRERLSEEQLPVFLAANGGPQPAGRGGRGGAGGRGGGGGNADGLVVSSDPLESWMNAASLARVAALGNMYRDAGVTIYGFKRGGPNLSDPQLDYNFEMAKAIGAEHITLELPTNAEGTDRMGAFGTKHGVRVGYHTHTQARFDSFDVALRQHPANAINVDVGHYQAGTSTSALPLLRKYPDRVASIHLKDRQNNEGPNMMWGQGDTPLIEILQAIRDEKWTFPATIELEYQPPAGSDRLVEIGRCRAYCVSALLT